MNENDLFRDFESQLTPPQEEEYPIEKAITKKDGNIFVRLQDGRKWCPSRQCRGGDYSYTEKDIEQLNEKLNPSDSFTAVDFETATPDRMICQVGIVQVVKGEVSKRIVKLVQPPSNQYHAMTIAVHGITPEMTRNAPTFDIVWKSIKRYLEKTKIVAHNASFDESALRKNLEYYAIKATNIKEFVCTCKLYNNANLHNLCEAFDIDTSKHHNALFDAECCAQFYLNYINGIEPKHPLPQKNISKFQRDNEQTDFVINLTELLPQKSLSSLHPIDAFLKKKFLITGNTLFDRELAYRIIEALGGKKSSFINKSLNYVVVGANPGPSKMEQLEKLRSEGFEIRILSTDEFIDLLKFNFKDIR